MIPVDWGRNWLEELNEADYDLVAASNRCTGNLVGRLLNL
jgi:hypothetical protein